MSESTRIPPRRKSKGDGQFMFSALILVLVIASLLGMYFYMEDQKSQSEASVKVIAGKVQNIEDNLSISNEDSAQNMDTVTDQISLLDKEVRKLWDLSNKRNRKNISENLNSIESLNEKIESIDKKDEVLSAQQRALTLELARIKNIQENINSQIDSFDDTAPVEIGSDRLTNIEESIDSFNAYRVQVNQSLLNLREELNELELALSQAENE